MKKTRETVADFIIDATRSINFESPMCLQTNRIGLQNRVIDIAVALYLCPTNEISLLSAFSAPSSYYEPDIAGCELSASHYGVYVGSPTGKYNFDYKKTQMSVREAQAFMLRMKAAIKVVMRKFVREHGLDLTLTLQSA